MSKGMPNMGGMGGNMGNIMRQAQKMQKEVAAAQELLSKTEYVGNSVDDFAVVKMNGDKKIIDIKIDEKIIDPDDPDTLQDMLIDALNDGFSKVDKDKDAKLGKYTNGLM
ncbi:YbaB/EbfC family nucleoid-associated protein [Companilactobacillus allii]|uniref:Nucleoid-associated protein BTM29_00335 n=1 Tax=Companilactobacillus allii TaxID=1847728 RepID=A0A1P8PZU9_9LACO|nr:YbaB/EbfC family nucleoid-associated protein [Companilactobacillus allii]APX71089.1 YbaB/EbfC family nucleoid-associated protein [Companilactobacillus allii]USQ68167.1 YbaB/EbfC family nucleoid-associated protein [Companilactobacillus allii]